MDFVAVDVETANSDISSICQIGIVVFKEGVMVDEWISLINPQSHFDRINIGIHGITDADVKDAPTFSEVAAKVTSYFKDHIVISHGPFDRNSLSKIFIAFSWLSVRFLIFSPFLLLIKYLTHVYYRKKQICTTIYTNKY